MKEIVIEQTGHPSQVAKIRDTVPRSLPPQHVRVRMLFAPVNPADLNYIEGTYGKKPVLPAVPGIEGVGRIVEIGEGVDGISLDQLVLPLAGMGTWAETVVRKQRDIFPLPDGIDLRQAAMLRVNPATAWGLLHAVGKPAPNMVVVQNAASSGCGHCVIQLSRHLGLRTINLVRRAESIPACVELGADTVLLDDTSAVAAARAGHDFTAPTLALNAVGGDSAVRLMDLLAPGGTMVTYGAMARQPVKVPNGFLIFKDVRLCGFWLSRWLEQAPRDEICRLYGELASLVLAGALKQTVAAEYAIAAIHEALDHASRDARGGKVLLRFDDL
jgi:mitochondrial enoyl-[acyl-carrier protein] reductase / trans-2-enoyl-CoA reductase